MDQWKLCSVNQFLWCHECNSFVNYFLIAIFYLLCVEWGQCAICYNLWCLIYIHITYIRHCPPLLCVTETFLWNLGTCLNASVWEIIDSLRRMSCVAVMFVPATELNVLAMHFQWNLMHIQKAKWVNCFPAITSRDVGMVHCVSGHVVAYATMERRQKQVRGIPRHYNNPSVAKSIHCKLHIVCFVRVCVNSDICTYLGNSWYTPVTLHCSTMVLTVKTCKCMKKESKLNHSCDCD